MFQVRREKWSDPVVRHFHLGRGANVFTGQVKENTTDLFSRSRGSAEMVRTDFTVWRVDIMVLCRIHMRVTHDIIIAIIVVHGRARLCDTYLYP